MLSAVRVLRRSREFTATASATLALVIVSTSAIFGVLYGTFFAPLPYRNAGTVVAVWVPHDGRAIPAQPNDSLLWKRHATLFADLQT